MFVCVIYAHVTGICVHARTCVCVYVCLCCERACACAGAYACVHAEMPEEGMWYPHLSMPCSFKAETLPKFGICIFQLHWWPISPEDPPVSFPHCSGITGVCESTPSLLQESWDQNSGPHSEPLSDPQVFIFTVVDPFYAPHPQLHNVGDTVY